MTEDIQVHYDAMMFARSPKEARYAAQRLVRAVLGDDAAGRPLDQTLRECCRVLRPAPNPLDEARFEDEFVELGLRSSIKLHRTAA
jgi:hypothetical protein